MNATDVSTLASTKSVSFAFQTNSSSGLSRHFSRMNKVNLFLSDLGAAKPPLLSLIFYCNDGVASHNSDDIASQISVGNGIASQVINIYHK